VHRFQPSFSEWKIPANDAISYTHDINAETRDSPSLRLIERLAKANSTLCFLGDSIDFQIYDALRNNLFRQQCLQEEISIKIESSDILVNYSSAGWEPPYHHFMTMERIVSTVVSLQYAHEKSRVLNSTIRYFQMYGRSPWNTAFTEDCNVLILNIGYLHYNARGDMLGTHWGRPKLMDDIQGAITYLTDFVSTSTAGNRIAVWRLVLLLAACVYFVLYQYENGSYDDFCSAKRSSLPQHFNTTDRHYEQRASCSLEPLDENVHQKYNEAYEVGFAKLCAHQTQSCRNRREQLLCPYWCHDAQNHHYWS
jgi:hypothetical protein